MGSVITVFIIWGDIFPANAPWRLRVSWIATISLLVAPIFCNASLVPMMRASIGLLPGFHPLTSSLSFGYFIPLIPRVMRFEEMPTIGLSRSLIPRHTTFSPPALIGTLTLAIGFIASRSLAILAAMPSLPSLPAIPSPKNTIEASAAIEPANIPISPLVHPSFLAR